MNHEKQPGGLRCHDPYACAVGQKPCPTPAACCCAPTEANASISESEKEKAAKHYAVMAREARAAQAEPSPTAGMNIGQRILHVGGRENAAGYIEFGSVSAVRALVGQVLRDLQAAPPAQAQELGWRELFWSVTRALNCLPSTFVDGNAHVYQQAEKYAAIAAQAQDVQPIVLDDAWKRSMLDGRALARDEMGCGDHPAIPVLEEGMKPTQFFEALGIELVGAMAESEMDTDAYDAMVEAVDYNVWTPAAPDGEGWALVAIFDTEDGPAAWWMREAAPAKPTRKARKDERGAALPGWWPDFIQNVTELPDRNSPEDEPDAMIATAEELGTCAVNAIDAARAAQEA